MTLLSKDEWKKQKESTIAPITPPIKTPGTGSTLLTKDQWKQSSGASDTTTPSSSMSVNDAVDSLTTPASAAPASQKSFFQKYMDISNSVGKKVGGVTASFLGGLDSELGKIVDSIGGNIMRGLDKATFKSGEQYDAFKKLTEQASQEGGNIATENGVSPFAQKLASGAGGLAVDLPLFELGGEAITATKLPGLVSTVVNKFPAIGKYLAPVAEGFVKTAGAFETANLAKGDASWESFKKTLRDAGAFALSGGLIPSQIFAIPATGLLTFGLAKLDGASNEDAASAAILNTTLHAVSAVTGHGAPAVETHEQAFERVKNESVSKINKFSDFKITKDSTPEEIQKAYRDAAKKTHPDKGGKKEDFQGVNAAYDFLKTNPSEIKAQAEAQKPAPTSETTAPVVAPEQKAITSADTSVAPTSAAPAEIPIQEAKAPINLDAIAREVQTSRQTQDKGNTIQELKMTASNVDTFQKETEGINLEDPAVELKPTSVEDKENKGVFTPAIEVKQDGHTVRSINLHGSFKTALEAEQAVAYLTNKEDLSKDTLFKKKNDALDGIKNIINNKDNGTTSNIRSNTGGNREGSQGAESDLLGRFKRILGNGKWGAMEAGKLSEYAGQNRKSLELVVRSAEELATGKRSEINQHTAPILKALGFSNDFSDKVDSYNKKGGLKNIQVAEKINGDDYYSAFKENTLYINPNDRDSEIYKNGSIVDHEIAGHSWYLKLSKESQALFFENLKSSKDMLLTAWKANDSSHDYYWNETVKDVHRAILRSTESKDIANEVMTEIGLTYQPISLKEFVNRSLDIQTVIDDANDALDKRGHSNIVLRAEMTTAVLEHNAMIAEKAKEIETTGSDVIDSYVENIKNGTLEFGNRGSVQLELLKTKELLPYEGSKKLTLKTLEKLKGRTTVSKQFISDLTNSGDIKQIERDVIREVLAEYGDTVPVKDFIDRVEANLLPLTVIDTKSGGAYKDSRIYEDIALPKEFRGNVKNYEEHIYQSPIKNQAGEKHFSYLHNIPGAEPDKYFGHVRLEDMQDGTRRVIEIQSDLYQKGNLEKEIPSYLNASDYLPPDKLKQYKKIEQRLTNLTFAENSSDYKTEIKELQKEREDLEASAKDLEQKVIGARKAEVSKLQQYTNPTAHFRMVREEVKKAAEDSVTTLQFPTGETAMKIEGLGDSTQWSFRDDMLYTQKLTADKLKVGQEVQQGAGNELLQRHNLDDRGSWIITDVLGDGKFKAIQKDTFETIAEEIGDYPYPSSAIKALIDKTFPYSEFGNDVESFDISGKVDTNNPIYRFYEKDLGRYLKSNYGAELITDAQGVSWYQVSVDPTMAETPVMAFKIKKDISLNDLEAEYDHIFDSENLPMEYDAPAQLQEQSLQLDVMKQILKDSRAAEIARYDRKGEIKLTDAEATNLGFQSLEDAKKEYLQWKNTKEAYKNFLTDHRNAMRDYKTEQKDARALDRLLTKVANDNARIAKEIERQKAQAERIFARGRKKGFSEGVKVATVIERVRSKNEIQTLKEETQRKNYLAKLRENIETRSYKRAVLDAVKENIPPKERFKYLTDLSKTNFSPNKMERILKDVYDRKMELDIEHGERVERARRRSNIAFLKKIHEIEPVMIRDIKESLGITEPISKLNKENLDKITEELRNRINYRIQNNLVPHDNSRDVSFDERQKIATEAIRVKANKKNVFGKVVAEVRKQIGTIDTRIRRISPEMAEGLRTVDFNKSAYLNERFAPVRDFLNKQLKPMTEVDKQILQDSLYSRDGVNAREILNKYNIDVVAFMDSYRQILDDLYNKMRTVGVDISYLKDHFPRYIKQEFQNEIFDRYNEDLKKTQDEMRARQGRDLTDEEKQDIFAKYFRGFDRGNRILLSDGRFVEGRIIETIDDPRISAMYEDMMTSLDRYVNQAIDLYESRKFFNKIDPGLADQISQGEYTNVINNFLQRKAMEGSITADQVNELRDALQDFFGIVKVSGWQQALMQTAYGAGLNRLSSFVPQFLETGLYMATNDPRMTVQAARFNIKPSDIHVDILSDKGNLEMSKIVDYLTVPMRMGDRAGATAGINIMFRKLKADASVKKTLPDGKVQYGTTLLRNKIGYIFGNDNIDSVIGKINSTQGNIAGKDMPIEMKRLLYSEISQYRLIGKSDKSRLFIKHPFWGVFKNYTIKTLNAIWSFGNDEFKAGYEAGDKAQMLKGVTRKAMLIAALLAAGATQQAIKDWMHGSTDSLNDYILNSFLNIFGASKYNLSEVNKTDFMGALVDLAAPAPVAIPISFLENLLKDVTKYATDTTGEASIMDFKTLQQAPFIGDYFAYKQNTKQAQQQLDKNALKDSKKKKVPSHAASEFPSVQNGTYSQQSFMTHLVSFAKAVGVSPAAAFKDYFSSDNNIVGVVDGTIYVERLDMKSSEAIKNKAGKATKDFKLDHTIPLQLGGNNDASNLKLVSTEEWKKYTPVEDYLGALLKSKKITGTDARNAIRDFKNGKITFLEIKTKFAK